MKEVCGAVHPTYQVKCHRPPSHESILHFSSRVVDGLPRDVVWSTKR
jgi:hypothetical protein